MKLIFKNHNRPKMPYRAISKREFFFSVWAVIAFGWNKGWYQKRLFGKGTQVVTWYFLCFKLSATQDFEPINEKYGN